MQSASFYMHYDPFEIFIATGIRNFKAPLLATYREYIKNDAKREALHNILEELKTKGYSIPEPKYKRFPVGFEKEDNYSYLYKYASMYAFKTFEMDDIFHSEKIVERNFNCYKDMGELHQWVYELTLVS